MSIDRYADVGLRMNPFAGELLAEAHRELFVERGLPDPPPPGAATLVQVIGAKGAGKTTQILAWRKRNHGPYHYVPPGPYRDRWASPPLADVVYGDEIDRMPGLMRRSWFRRLARVGATVVAGTHVDLSGQARRAGLQVTTHTLGLPSARLLTELFTRRFEYVEYGAPTPIRLHHDELATIHQQADGSLRTAETLGHELVAQRAFELAEPSTDKTTPNSAQRNEQMLNTDRVMKAAR